MCGAVLAFILALRLSIVSADNVIAKLTDGLRYQYMAGPDGVFLEDFYLKDTNILQSIKYNPDADNLYYLYTRKHPEGEQLTIENYNSTAFCPDKLTVVIAHGWLSSKYSDVNIFIRAAVLDAVDANVLVLDWSAGAVTFYVTAVLNTVKAGVSLARFIDNLNAATGADPSRYHIIGHSLGGHLCGIAGRNVNGNVSYITAMDPALPLWDTRFNQQNRFRSTDADYTEVIHTNGGYLGYLTPLGDVDFYPNEGSIQPGCSVLCPSDPSESSDDVSHSSNEYAPTQPPLACDILICSHLRSYEYMAESITTGGFLSRECDTYEDATSGNCVLPGTLNMGGLQPKTGSTGIYYLQTHAQPPYSIGLETK